MSVLYHNNNGWVISHENFIANIYKNCITFQKYASFTLSHDLFSIRTPYMREEQLLNFHTKTWQISYNSYYNKNCKRKRDENSAKNVCFEEVELIKELFESLVSGARNQDLLKAETSPGSFLNNNTKAREKSEEFYSNLITTEGAYSGGNTSDCPIVVTINDKAYVLPRECSFYCCDVRSICCKLQNHEYDFILLDPPWWNKYIRRKKAKDPAGGYIMMYNKELADIAVGTLLAPNGLVAIWCTSAPSNIRAIYEDIFPAWGVRYTATWFWIKVTTSGEPVCSFSPPPGKQPYERIIFGCKQGRNEVFPNPEQNRCIISIPSALHSHKPPLVGVLESYLPETPRCLELFARYLLPGWTSCGNQVLAVQQLSLFTSDGSSA